MTSYRKTKDGQWVVFGTVAEVKLGPVQVRKASGEIKTESVTGLGRPFVVEGKTCVYGYLADKGTTAPVAAPIHRSVRSHSGRCKAPGCSAMATDRGYCRECAFDEFDD